MWVALGKVRGGASLSAGYPRLRQGSVSLGLGGGGGDGARVNRRGMTLGLCQGFAADSSASPLFPDRVGAVFQSG